MGVFAEFRQDLDNAARHYEGAYQTLVDMFHSSISGGVFAPGGGGSYNAELLHPFTPRWSEARTLADTISIKVMLILSIPSFLVSRLTLVDLDLQIVSIY
jgi:hypothetical protein